MMMDKMIPPPCTGCTECTNFPLSLQPPIVHLTVAKRTRVEIMENRCIQCIQCTCVIQAAGT